MLVPNSSLEKIFNHAVDTAKKYRHDYVTIEHMLFAMLHDESFNEFLSDFGIKVEDMGKDLARYLESQLDSIKTKKEGEYTPKKTSSLERVFNRCFTSVLFLGKDEIDSGKGHVSWISPIAKSLLGKKAGDQVSLQVPSGEVLVSVEKVTYEQVT